jgi:excisionase family DNA binding protein
MSYTLATAAAACGVNKSTILRAIKAGKISAVRDEHGQWQVEPAELHRVYPPVATPGTDATRRYVPADAATLALADQRAALAEGRLVELKEMLADMQRDRNAWRDQAQRLALPKPEAAPMSWWRWLRTTR